MNLIKEAEKFTIEFFEANIPESFAYHSIEHTRFVVKMVEKIAIAEGVDDLRRSIVLIAAWFHDIGYAVSYNNHEEESIKIVSKFLREKNAEEKYITEVEKCIKATIVGAHRETLLEKIIADADHAHTGLESFMELSNLFRKETCNVSEKKQTKVEYWEKTLLFLKRIQFLTNYAKNNMEDQKNQNIEKVENRIEKLKSKKKGKGKKTDIKSTVRGIETIFRSTARNQINLSSIADNKANIMLTINSVLLSVLVSTSALSFQRETSFLVPVLVLTVACLTSLVFSILSVRPNISAGQFTDDDIKNKNVNLLFFGNFYDVDYPKYEKAVKTMMDDYDFLYGNLIKDQYNLGKVLARKYKLLSIAYNFFMFGFIIAIVTYLGFLIF